MERHASSANLRRAERVIGKGSPPQAWPVVVFARERVAAEELVGGSLGIGLTLEAIHLHFEFCFALVEATDQSRKLRQHRSSERVQINCMTTLSL